jgi:hypothetical protein
LSQGAKLRQEQEAFKAAQAKAAEDLKLAAAIKAASGKKNPIEILRAAGYPEGEISNFLMTHGKVDPEIAAVQDEIRATKAELQALKDAKEQEAAAVSKQKETAEVAAYRKTMIESVETDKFPLIKAERVGAKVLDVLRAHHEKTGVQLDLEQAAKMVEEQMAAGIPKELDGYYANPAMRPLLEAARSRWEASQKAKPAEATPEKAAAPETNEVKEKAAKIPRPLARKPSKAAPATGSEAKKRTPQDVWRELNSKFQSA